MCNLSGYFGFSPNKNKLKILALLGRERGTDSFGVSINGVVVKDVSLPGYKNPDWGDSTLFIQKHHDYYQDLDQTQGTFNKIIQHNRKKSSGVVKLKSAHPFVMNYTLDGDNTEHEFTLIHNGTITNPFELCNKFGKKFSDFDSDSEALAELIMEFGPEEVLPWYEGGAALVFTFSHEPNKVYMWKGASVNKSWNYQTRTFNNSTEVVEERPLHYAYDEDGVYFASLTSHIEAVLEPCGTEEVEIKGEKFLQNKYPEIYQVGNNCLYVFNETKLENSINIERKEIPYVAPKKTNQNYSYGYTSKYENDSTNNSDKLPAYYRKESDEKTNKVFFNGYKYIHKTVKGNTVKTCRATGIFQLDVEGNVHSKISNEPKDKYTEFYFFYDGAMIKDRTVLEELYKRKPSDIKLSQNYIHGAYRNKDGIFFIGATIQKNRLFKPLFSKYYISTNQNGYFKNMLTLEEVMKGGQLNKYQLAKEFFCTCFNLETTAAHYYSLKNYTLKELQWEEFSIDAFMGGIPQGYEKNAHKKYLDWEKKSITNDTKNKEDKKDKKDKEDKEDTNSSTNNIIQLPPPRNAIETYNHKYGTSFTTKKECNTHYYLNEGGMVYEYNTNWGLDQEEIKKAILEDCDDTCDDLPFSNTYLDPDFEEINKSAQKEGPYMKAREAFSEDFQAFEELSQNIYDRYFGMNFEEDDEVSEYWENFEVSHRILQGTLVLN